MLPVIGSFTSAIPGEPVAIALINNSAGSIKSLPGAPGVSVVSIALCPARYQRRVCVPGVIPDAGTAFRHYSCESKRPSNCYINALFGLYRSECRAALRHDRGPVRWLSVRRSRVIHLARLSPRVRSSLDGLESV